MDWFETLTGFHETSYAETKSKLEVSNGKLRSRINGATYETGTLELVSLQTLRDRAHAAGGLSGPLKASVATGNVRHMHQSHENAGALFQVASQFNLLEMTGPEITPEHGITRYENDHTQGPACAIAAGAATIYRNYFAPVEGESGQTATRQFDALAPLGAALSAGTGLPVTTLWTMQNGYALATAPGLAAINQYLRTLDPDQTDALRGKLCIGLHRDIEATEAPGPDRPIISQAFCSALPIAYSAVPFPQWELLAKLVLESAYEATLWAAVLNAQRNTSNTVFLTRLGGGAFGNPNSWITAAIDRALTLLADYRLDIRLVSYGPT